MARSACSKGTRGRPRSSWRGTSCLTASTPTSASRPASTTGRICERASMTEPRKIARYGWIPDLPDDRDHLYAAPPAILGALPASTDLRTQCPPVYDQGMLGSCTANAIGGAIEFDRLKQSLADFVPSRPFIFGFTVYESFESPSVAQTGHAPMPGPTERAVGGHAVMAVGYDEASQTFLARNSWGEAWGIAGYFTMPYTYLVQPGLASDLWTIRLVGA